LSGYFSVSANDVAALAVGDRFAFDEEKVLRVRELKLPVIRASSTTASLL
jgi:hypothetical protein